MEQTKIFSGTLTTDEKLMDLEQVINSWLEENRDVKITSDNFGVAFFYFYNKKIHVKLIQ